MHSEFAKEFDKSQTYKMASKLQSVKVHQSKAGMVLPCGKAKLHAAASAKAASTCKTAKNA